MLSREFYIHPAWWPIGEIVTTQTDFKLLERRILSAPNGQTLRSFEGTTREQWTAWRQRAANICTVTHMADEDIRTIIPSLAVGRFKTRLCLPGDSSLNQTLDSCEAFWGKGLDGEEPFHTSGPREFRWMTSLTVTKQAHCAALRAAEGLSLDQFEGRTHYGPLEQEPANYILDILTTPTHPRAWGAIPAPPAMGNIIPYAAHLFATDLWNSRIRSKSRDSHGTLLVWSTQKGANTLFLTLNLDMPLINHSTAVARITLTATHRDPWAYEQNLNANRRLGGPGPEVADEAAEQGQTGQIISGSEAEDPQGLTKLANQRLEVASRRLRKEVRHRLHITGLFTEAEVKLSKEKKARRTNQRRWAREKEMRKATENRLREATKDLMETDKLLREKTGQLTAMLQRLAKLETQIGRAHV